MISGERAAYDRRAWAATAARHRAAYSFAQVHARGRRVVEVGCGTGHGARLLAEVASQVLAIDISAAAIAAAAASVGKANVSFRRADAMELSPAELQCDLLVAFQVVEHLPDAERFAALAAEATRPRGVLLISTPNARLSHGANPYHAREFTADELKEMLARLFCCVELFGVHGSQRAISYDRRRTRLAQAVLRLDILGLRRTLPRQWVNRVGDIAGEAIKRYLMWRGGRSFATSWDDDYFVAKENLDGALDILAVCGHGLPRLETAPECASR